MHFLEVSDTGPRGHFVDLDELQRSVWSGPLAVGRAPTRETGREQNAYTCTGVNKPVWRGSGGAKGTFWRFQPQVQEDIL